MTRMAGNITFVFFKSMLQIFLLKRGGPNIEP